MKTTRDRWIQVVLVTVTAAAGLYLGSAFFERRLNPTAVDLTRQSDPHPPLLELPRKFTNLYVLLPRDARPGQYEMELLAEKEAAGALLKFSIPTKPEHGYLVLDVDADLRSMPTGRYILRVGKTGVSHDYTVEVR